MNKKILLGLIPIGVVTLVLVGVAGFMMMLVMVVSTITGQDPPDMDIQISDTGKNEIPAEFIDIYKEAGYEHGVPWTLLAGIHKIETNFSTNKTESYAGAVGAMQFMPCTWVGWNHPTCSGLGAGSIPKSDLTDPAIIKKYGGYGLDANGDGKADPDDEEDAIHAAAKYLAASGADGTMDGMRSAVFTYNNADWYVDEVIGYYNQYTDGDYESIEVGKVTFSGEKAYPVVGESVVTSEFGPRWGTHHSGIDIAVPGNARKTKIVSFGDGKVVAATDGCSEGNYSCGGGYGNFVMIEHSNVVSVYAHLANGSVQVGTGDKIKAGDLLGIMGNTGHSKGMHLHFEIQSNGKKIDPAPYLNGF